mmetsp:Transcript_13568/g.54393  ORF Transcript_13568/g.54393 Transcript_13568/m.54393 type:complete len:87 (+) Transcript_13568:312-572(+)
MDGNCTHYGILHTLRRLSLSHGAHSRHTAVEQAGCCWGMMITLHSAASRNSPSVPQDHVLRHTMSIDLANFPRTALDGSSDVPLLG